MFIIVVNDTFHMIFRANFFYIATSIPSPPLPFALEPFLECTRNRFRVVFHLDTYIEQQYLACFYNIYVTFLRNMQVFSTVTVLFREYIYRGT